MPSPGQPHLRIKDEPNPTPLSPTLSIPQGESGTGDSKHEIELASTERGGTPGPSTKAGKNIVKEEDVLEAELFVEEATSELQSGSKKRRALAESAPIDRTHDPEAPIEKKGKKAKIPKPKKKRHTPVYMGRNPRDSSEARLALDRKGETPEMTAAREAEVEAFAAERLALRTERLARNAWQWQE